MAAGEKWSQEIRDHFRAEYLYSGNACAAIRCVNKKLTVEVNKRTANDWANELLEDADFQKERRKLRKRALDDLVTERMRLVERASKRFHSKTGGIDVKRFGDPDDGKVIITDKRYEYGKLILDAEKNAHHLAKMDAGETASTERPQRIEVVLTDGGDYQPSKAPAANE